jgi:ribosomal subunit interface protein
MRILRTLAAHKRRRHAMPFRVSGKNIDIGEALRIRVGARIAETMAKFFDGGYSGHVTVGKEGFGFRTDCAVHLDSGTTLHADGMAADAYASADEAALRMEQRLRRYKKRLKGRSPERLNGGTHGDVAVDAQSYVIVTPDHDSDEDIGEFTPVVVAESTTTLERLSVSEAVMELDMTGAPVVVFRHAAHGGVNIVYRRADGNVGWVDPPVKKSG